MEATSPASGRWRDALRPAMCGWPPHSKNDEPGAMAL